MCDQNSFEEILKKSIKNDEDIIDTLNNLLEEMEKVHHNANVAKTVGTTTSTLGTVVTIGSIVAAPFTGGVSLLVGLGGTAASLAGGLTNIVTDVIENRISSNTIEKIKTIVENKSYFDKQLKTMIDNFGEIVERLKSEGICEEHAVEATLSAIANGKLDLMNTTKNKICITALSAYAKLATGHHLVQKGFQILGVSSKNLRFIASFFNVSSKTMKTMGTVFPIASAVFTVIDLGILVKDWKSDPPTSAVINDLIKQIKEEKTNLNSVKKILASIRSQNENESKKCTCRPFHINVLYLNVRSINPNNPNRNRLETIYGFKINAIKQLISENKPDIIAFVETWLNIDKDQDKDIKTMLNLKGYEIYRQDRFMDKNDSAYQAGGLVDDYPFDLSDVQDRRGGGIMVAVKTVALVFQGITVRPYPDEDMLDAISNYVINWDRACSKCDKSKQEHKKILFSVIYRRPKKFPNECDDSYENLNDSNINRMGRLNSFYTDIGFNGVVMVGDFNMTRSDPKFENILMGNCVTDFKTTHRGGRAIDHVIYSPDDLVTNTVVTRPISDHRAILFDVQLGIGPKPFEKCRICQSNRLYPSLS